MAREIVAFCDRCFDTKGDRVPGTTRQLDLGQGSFEVEICDPCYDELVGPLDKLLVNHGREVVEPGSATAKLRCPWCPATLASVRNLRDHVGHKHSEQSGEFITSLVERKNGAAARAPSRRSERRECPECEFVAGSPQGLGAHRRSAHGVEGSSPSTVSLRRKRAAS